MDVFYHGVLTVSWISKRSKAIVLSFLRESLGLVLLRFNVKVLRG